MSDYIVLQHEGRTLASAVKTMYLLLFFVTAIPFLLYFMGAGDLFSETTIAKIKKDNNDMLLILRFLAFCVFVHFIRLYTTLELLEAPGSSFHYKNICNLGERFRRVEQLFRMLLLLFVSFKLIFLIDEVNIINVYFAFIDGKIDTIPELFMYLLILFIILLCWDIVVAIGNRSLNMMTKSPFFWLNVGGFICCVGILASFPEHPVVIIFFIVLLSISYIVSFVIDFIFNYHKQYFSFWRNFLKNIKSPFYGERYQIKGGEVYLKKQKSEFNGKCEENNCNFASISDAHLVLTPLNKKNR